MVNNKHTLSPTPALNNDLLADIRQLFTPDEIEVIAIAVAGSPPTEVMIFGEMFRRRLRASSLLQSMVRRWYLDVGTLVDKLERATPEMRIALGRAVEAWYDICLREGLYPWGRSSKVVLSRVGLHAVTGPAAWGFAVAIHQSTSTEFVLRDSPDAMDFDPMPDVASLAQAVLEQHRDWMMDPEVASRLVTQLAKLTGHRYFRLDGRPGHPILTAITTSALAHDLADGSLRHLWLQGVNAPRSGT
ncbi:hypothetical protein [Lichenifustis flavocetrariae]|uniref:Uncharacterized protein n=1 Tax=Lichenifustis flavocetrariae TaxID=2949735 RepID=A0AA41Z870_9HYPH|nr:hypothetical protein [Lichenifustis flavocetrariae]MCW6512308.1 hypothetical protein [Lichenifustis flavocetrariae]